MANDSRMVLCAIASSPDDVATCLEAAVQYCNRAIQTQAEADFLRSLELYDFAVALLKYTNPYSSLSFTEALIGKASAMYWHARTCPTRINLINLKHAERLLHDSIAYELSLSPIAVCLFDETSGIDSVLSKQQLSDQQRTQIAIALETIRYIRQLYVEQAYLQLTATKAYASAVIEEHKLCWQMSRQNRESNDRQKHKR